MNKFKQVTNLLPIYFKAIVDKKTPILAKILALGAIAYIILPADVIPDLIPILGKVDDTILTAALIYFSNQLIPQEIKDDKKIEKTTD